MIRAFQLFLIFAIFFNSTASSAFVGSLFKKSPARDTGYLATAKGKDLKPCEINFVKMLNGQLPKELFSVKKTNLWSDEFSPRIYLDELNSIKDFASKANKIRLVEDLAKMVHKDEIFMKNVADLANLMRNEGQIPLARFKEIFIDRKFPFAKFTYSHAEKKIVATMVIDPEKARLIEDTLKRSKLGKNMQMEYRQILRGSDLTAEEIRIGLEHGMKLRRKSASLETFRNYIEFLGSQRKRVFQGSGDDLGWNDRYFVGKAIRLVGDARVREGMKHIEDIYKPFKRSDVDVMKWLKPHRKFLEDTPENISREAAIQRVVADSDMLASYKKEYKIVLRKSGLTQEQIEYAHEVGMTLRGDDESLQRFKEYMVYLDYLPQYKIKKGLENIDKIYRYTGEEKFFYIPPGFLPPHQQFAAQRARMLKKQADIEKREIERFKSQKAGLEKELMEHELALTRGELVDLERMEAIRSELDQIRLSPAQLKRIKAAAAAKTSIFRRLVNGCNGGGSARLASAKKKFKAFKFSLALGATPLLYAYNNWDKRDEDEYLWHKLGHEVGMGFLFTYVSNIIVTNTDKGFWRRYGEGLWKFGLLDVASTASYDDLFGSSEHIRYINALFTGEMKPSKLEMDLEELKNSPTFDQDMQELLAYLDEMAEKSSFRNYLDKHINLSAYTSLEDDFKITQEDLETEEGREVLLELLAERLYLENMGDQWLFQTGNSGRDRWTFFRVRNVGMDIKSMAVNLAIFEIMCRQPFGASKLGEVANWLLAGGIVMADTIFIGNLTYGWRRDAINQ